MGRVRVLQIVPKLITGGGQRVAMDLVKHLDCEQFEVEVVSLYPFSNEVFESYAKDSGIIVHYLTKRPGLDPTIFLEINKIFQKFCPQVVHNHLYSLYAMLPSSYINRIPVRIQTIHTVANEESKGLYRLVSTMAFHNLGVLPVSISQSVQTSVHQVYGKISSPVIYNGIDTQLYAYSEHQRHKWREKYGIPENAFVFVNVASFSSVKNQQLLVRAFGEALKFFPSSFLVLVGDGETHQEISGLVKELDILNKVFLTGKTLDVAQILSASDCFVLSSLWEGLPISVLEAMAEGKPIISTNVGAIPELITNRENGLLVPVGDGSRFAAAMIEMCKNPLSAAEMGKRGRQTIEQRFDVRNMAEQYGDLYLRVLGEKASLSDL
jgi:glycosyltransferase involved in cell wall biosynthesis